MKLQPHLFYSGALMQRKTCYVLLPDHYDASEKRYPVVYLLHGIYGSETDWIYRGHAQDTVDLMNKQRELRECIIVIPSDGGFEKGTFYMDWYDGSGRFEQYFIYDLVQSIDSCFRTIPEKQARAVAGLSMGGFGSLLLALRNPSVFGAAASMSGPLGIVRAHPESKKLSTLWDHGFMRHEYEVARLLGPVGGPYAREHDLFYLTDELKDDPYRPYVYFDCGTEDYLYEHSVAMNKHLQKIGYPHVFQKFAGDHTWAYWTEHLRDALQFVEECFAMMNPQ